MDALVEGRFQRGEWRSLDTKVRTDSHLHPAQLLEKEAWLVASTV